MEYLTGFALGVSIGVWGAVIVASLKRKEHQEALNEITKPIKRVFTKTAKHRPKVNDDSKAWKLENKREV